MFLTSNNTRELSEALKRRCLFLHVDYPDIDREKEIVRVRVPEIDDALAEQVAKVVNSIRNIDLKKSPSISETIDWARTLVYLGRNEITPEVLGDTLHILLKYQSDIGKARKELGVDAPRTVTGGMTGGRSELPPKAAPSDGRDGDGWEERAARRRPRRATGGMVTGGRSELPAEGRAERRAGW